MKFKKWEPDKWKHFYVGIPLGAVLQFSAGMLFAFPLCTAVIAAFVCLVAISYGFEFFSLITGWGHHDFMDAIAGIIGGCIGMFLVIMVTWLLTMY